MRRALLVSALCIAAVMGGCATSPQSSTSPQEAVFAAKSAYAGVLVIAVAYKRLPSCAQAPRPALCSDAAVVKKVQDADEKAFAAMTTAENIVRNPAFGTNTQSYINAANEALVAFTSITASLRVR